MTGYDTKLRIKVNRRWEELETQQQKPVSTLDFLSTQLELMRKQEAQINENRSRIDLLEAKTATKPDYFTIVGYGTLNNISVNIKLASKLGRQASKICKEQGLLMDEIPDARFGKVRMYPKTVLEEVFSSAPM